MPDLVEIENAVGGRNQNEPGEGFVELAVSFREQPCHSQPFNCLFEVAHSNFPSALLPNTKKGTIGNKGTT